MPDPRIETISREQLELECSNRRAAFAAQVNRLHFKASIANASGSSRAALMVIELYKQEFKIRAGIALSVLARACQKIGLSGQGNAGPLIATLHSILDGQAKTMMAGLTSDSTVAASIHSGSFSLDQVTSLFEQARAENTKRVCNEVELFVAELERSMTKDESRERVTVSGIGNVVQLGSFLNSPASISINAGNKKELEEVLTAVEAEIANLPKEVGLEVEELQGVIVDARQELAAEKPNKIKLGSLLTGLATSIQTTASLQPAYQALKLALAAIGIPLP